MVAGNTIEHPMEQGLALYHSNDLEALAGSLLARVEGFPRSTVLQPVPIVVPHPGLGRWLSQWFAERSGISANLEFLLPAQFVWRMVRNAEPDLPRDMVFDAGVLAWRIHRLLDGGVAGEEGLEAVRRFLVQGDDLEVRRMQLARSLAACFAAYLPGRPDWVLSWSNNKQPDDLQADAHAAWQRRVWAAVDAITREETGVGLADSVAAIRRVAGQLGPDTEGLPRRLLAFGISHLPRLFLEFFLKIATCRPLDLFFLNPCREYWEPGVSERRRLRREVRALRRGEPLRADPLFEVDHPLLAAAGRHGGEFLRLVLETDVPDNLPETLEPEYRSGTPTVLGALQDSLRDLEAPLAEYRGPDESIQVHACHSPLREVQVLRDQLLKLLESKPDLRARDILVLAPDIGVYAPYVRAVFGSGSPNLPFNVSDRSPLDEHPIAAVFSELLSLPAMAFNVNQVMSIIEVPAVSRRLGLDEEQLGNIRRWLADTRISWGLDGDHRSELGAGRDAANSWQHGLSRMLVGVAVDQDDRLVGDRVLPYPEIEGRSAEAAGRLAWFIRWMKRVREKMGTELTAPEWADLLTEQLFQGLFTPDPDDADEVQAADHVQAAIDQFRRQAEAGGVDQPFSWRVMREALEPLLADVPARQSFLSGGITFANMVPMRSVPARVICLLGLNEGDFPRRARAAQFDLLARYPRVGDRSVLEDDRYLFLESLISARDVLYLSYIGCGLNDNEQREPSPLVKTLLQFVNADRTRVSTVRHPLQPFSERAFDPDHPELQSCDAAWLPAAQAAGRGTESEPPFSPPAVVTAKPLETIELSDLVHFYRNPARHFLERECDVFLRDYTPELTDDDPLETGSLADYWLRLRVIERALENGGEMPPLPDARFLAHGDVPPGRRGQELVSQHAAQASAYARRIHRYRTELGEPGRRLLEVDVPRPDAAPVRIVGVIPVRGEATQFEWHASGLKPKRILPAVLRHLVLATERDDARTVSLGFDGKPEAAQRLVLEGITAEPWLSSLVEIYLRGRQYPLPLFPQTAFEWVRARHDGDDSALSRDAWKPRYGDAPPTEGDDPYIAMVTRGWSDEALFGHEFQRLADAVFGPLFGLETESGAGLGEESLDE